MVVSTEHRRSTTHPPPRRRFSRWCVQRSLSRVARAGADTTLGYLVDIGRGGFQISLVKPLPPVDDAELWLMLNQFPKPPQIVTVKATLVWLDDEQTNGPRCAGFRFDELTPSAVALILYHIKVYKTGYALIPADIERSAQPLIQAIPARKNPDVTSPRPRRRRSPVTVIVFGFSEREQQLLNNIVTLSALRSPSPGTDAPTYLLHTVAAMTAADLVLVDADNPNAVAACSAYLLDKPAVPTLKLSNQRGADTDLYTLPWRFVPQQLLTTLDAACRESVANS